MLHMRLPSLLIVLGRITQDSITVAGTCVWNVLNGDLVNFPLMITMSHASCSPDEISNGVWTFSHIIVNKNYLHFEGVRPDTFLLVHFVKLISFHFTCWECYCLWRCNFSITTLTSASRGSISRLITSSMRYHGVRPIYGFQLQQKDAVMMRSCECKNSHQP